MVLACPSVFAQDEAPTQITPQNHSGALPYAATLSTGVESLDLVGGSPRVVLPISQTPGRKMGFDFSLVYDARFWVSVQRGGSNPFYIWNIEERPYLPLAGVGLGWTTNEPHISWTESTAKCIPGGWPDTAPGPANGGKVTIDSNYIYHDASGAQHPLAVNLEHGDCPMGEYDVRNVSGPDLTGTGMLQILVDGPNAKQVLLPDGTANHVGGDPIPNNFPVDHTVHASAALYTDVYGNSKMEVPGGLDTLGRSLLSRTDSSNQTVYSVFDASGNPRTYTVNYVDLAIQTAFNLPAPLGMIHEYTGTRKTIASVVQPNGQAYRFFYDSYGMLTELDFPTGAKITYTWDNDPMDHVRYVTSRTLNVNGNLSTWTIQRQDYSAACGCRQITVTDAQSNQTVYSVSREMQILGAVTHVSIYQGSATGTPLRDYAIEYHGTSIGASDIPDVPIILPTRITTKLPNGLISKKEFNYDTAIFPHKVCDGAGSGAYWECVNSVFIVDEPVTTTRGNVIAAREYDWGIGESGKLLRTTTNQYLHDVNPNYAAVNIVDKIVRQTVTDGNGNTVADTESEYDNNTTTGPYRGSLTKAKHWRNTDGAWVSTSYAYDAYGNITSTTDPLGNHTSWSYDDNWAPGSTNCLPPSNSRAYVTQKTDALGHRTQVARWPCTAQIQSHKDENDILAGRTGTTYLYDLLNRPLQSNEPDGGQTTLAYNDAAPYPSVTSTEAIDAATNRTSVKIVDGLGRVVTMQLTSGPQGTVTIKTVYDTLGRVSQVSNPYRSTGDSTYGLTTTQYDALGRPIALTRQDGGVVTTDYSQFPTVTVTDESGRQRASRTDALGQLISVYEPGTSNAGVPASGTITINGPVGSVSTPGQPAKQATGSVTIGGGEQQVPPSDPCPQPPHPCPNVWDAGTVSISINGFSKSVSYGHFSGGGVQTTSSGIATTLRDAFNNDSNSPVTASVPPGTTEIDFLSKAGGANTNYPLSESVTSNVSGNGSFTTTQSGPSLSNGADAVPLVVYDNGTVTVTVDGTTQTVNYGQGSTPGSIAQLLVQAFAGDTQVSASVTGASSSQATLKFVAAQASALADYSLSAASATTQNSYFANPSITAVSSGSALSGGLDPSPAGLGMMTFYKYDTLGNLLCVEQRGDAATGTGCASYPNPTLGDPWHPRMFAYNSLSELLNAHNPETGNISYTYDDDGNVLTKTDARGAVINHSPSGHPIDPLNRVTGITYSTGDPSTTFTYDQGTNGVGYRTAMTDASGSTNWTYESMGRVTTEQRTVNSVSTSVTRSIGYLYNLLGGIKQITYPDSTIMKFDVDAAGNDTSAIDSSNNINYVQSALYAPDGKIASFTGHAGSSAITNAFVYNPRLQICREVASTTGILPTSCTASGTGNILDFQYDFHLGNGVSSSDNGNLYTAINNKDTTRNQIYTYDTLNRLLTARTSGSDCTVKIPGSSSQTEYWGESFNYDAWGNLTAKNTTLCSAENQPLAVDTVKNNNRLAAYNYDAAGNMLNDGGTGVLYAYDAESQLVSTPGYGYVYDGDGNRVEKYSGSTGTLYWYGAPGILAETDLTGAPQSDYVFFNGVRVARRDLSGIAGSVYYYFGNQINSASVITDASGNIEDEADYYPWGGLMQYSSGIPNHYWFTGKERDSESGLDYFGARYYSNGLARFTSVDPIWVKGDRVLDPQRLNLYAYGRNNPLKFKDPTGMDVTLGKCSGGAADKCFNLLEKGLRKEDRSHVHLVQGNGKNGFKQGVFGVAVDKDYKSDSKNFTTLQTLANDHSATGVIDVLGKGDTTTIRVGVGWSEKNGTTLGNVPMTMNGKSVPFQGYTFFEFRGKIEDGIMYTPGDYSQVVLNNSGLTDVDVSANMHHELTHLLLGDFGRSALKAVHSSTFNSDQVPRNEADRLTKAAEQEARTNAN
jgi:RHS repeat-associated protein